MKSTAFIWIAVLLLLWGVGQALSRPLLEARGYSRAVLDRDGRLLRLTLSGDEKYRLHTALRDISPELVEAVLLHEDRHFYQHFGVNPWSLAKAAVNTYWRGTRRMGGSTITMQVVRLMTTTNSKTVAGKLQQIAGAVILELFHSKQEILEAYLDLLPFGANVEGIGSASRIYFRKTPRDLTLGESLTLAVIPQSPSLRHLSVKGGPMDAARTRLYITWQRLHPLASGSARELELPLIAKKVGELPFRAPHFVNLVLARNQAPILNSTLESGLQTFLEQKVKAFVAAQKARGIRNATVMVIEHATMEVLGLVGSADFFAADIQGQVNGVLAKRSPGSTLKPFVYALALDQGLIHPRSLLKDTPMSFSGFDPENFDRNFTGPVHATEALVRSRNVPAVYLTSLLHQPTFYEFLKESGIKKLRDPAFYGLSLSLGGAELTMEELVELYAALANGGRLRPARFLRDEKAVSGQTILSKESAFLTLDMLRQNPRNEGYLSEAWLRDAKPVAWKTGTSQGFRDAWSMAVMGPYVIAVWLGNFDGEPNPALIGRDLAAPLLFALIDGLKAKATGAEDWLSHEGLNLKKVQVCSLSGALPGPYCHHREEAWFIPGRSPIAPCTIHREILLSPKTGLRACDDTRPGLRHEIFEFWPSDLLQVFKLAGLARRPPPAFEAACATEETKLFGLPPVITSPKRDVVYGLDGPEGESHSIPLQAVSDGDVTQLFWFIGGEFIGKSTPQMPLHWASRPGKFMVRVVDDLGRFDARELRVQVSR